MTLFYKNDLVQEFLGNNFLLKIKAKLFVFLTI